MSSPRTCGERIRELRIFHEMTLAELGNKIGIKGNTLGSYEIGRRIPDYLTIVKIAHFFHVSVDLLVDNEVEFEYHPRKMDCIPNYLQSYYFRILSSFTGTQQKQVYELIQSINHYNRVHRKNKTRS